jgi:phospholipid-binding lipoprotein MlaA
LQLTVAGNIAARFINFSFAFSGLLGAGGAFAAWHQACVNAVGGRGGRTIAGNTRPHATKRSALVKIVVRMYASVALLGLTACAHVPTDPTARAEYEKANDPAEPTNRAIFAGNQFIDRHVLKPVTNAYLEHVPEGARRSIHNFVTNLGEPAVLVNDVLQGNMGRAWTTTQRFAVNTTVGVAGLFDPATHWGLSHHTADFGQTFGVWGMGPGPSVQLPLLSFSNVRDTAGRIVGFVANPLDYVVPDATAAGGGLDVVDTRAKLMPLTNQLEETSLDYYAALRSAMAQRRAALVEEGKSGGREPAPTSAAPDSPSAAAAP